MQSMPKLAVILAVLTLLASAALAGPFVHENKNVVIDRPVTGGESTRGLLDCTDAIELNLGDVYTMSTVGYPANVDDWSNCWPYPLTGPEVVFHVFLATPVYWELTLTQDVADVDLVVLEVCEESECVFAVDSGRVWTSHPVEGELYFVVDGYNGAAGDFTLSFQELPPPPSACDYYTQAFPGASGEPVDPGTYSLSGDTCDSENFVANLECAAYTELGLDEFYEIYLLPGAGFTATITNEADGALWVLDACEDIGNENCLGYADDTLTGEPEVVSYTNYTGSDKGVWLVVDSYGTDSCGAFTGEIVLTPPGAVETEHTTWGTMKALYR